MIRSCRQNVDEDWWLCFAPLIAGRRDKRARQSQLTRLAWLGNNKQHTGWSQNDCPSLERVSNLWSIGVHLYQLFRMFLHLPQGVGQSDVLDINELELWSSAARHHTMIRFISPRYQQSDWSHSLSQTLHLQKVTSQLSYEKYATSPPATPECLGKSSI